MAKLVGMNFSKNAEGIVKTTLQLNEDYSSYYSDKDAGRGCIGQKANSVYVGDYDCSALKIGMEIEIYYGETITTAKGSFAPIKKIEVVTKWSNTI